MKKNAGLWLLAAGIAAVVVYEEFFASGHIPAGYQPLNVAGGATVPASASPAAGMSPGQFAFVLPKGAKWTGATVTPNADAHLPGVLPVPWPLPSNTSAPLLVTGIVGGTAVIMGWVLADGSSQMGSYVFT